MMPERIVGSRDPLDIPSNCDAVGSYDSGMGGPPKYPGMYAEVKHNATVHDPGIKINTPCTSADCGRYAIAALV